jgi:uncharacterized protein
MLWTIHCLDRPNCLDLRLATRPRHVDYLGKAKDKIMFCGPLLSEDGQTMLGSMFVLNVASRAEAEAFSKGDPYSAAGLFETVVIRRVRKFIFEPDLAKE